MKNRNICIVTLGDLGQCPRMQNHAVQFAEYYPRHTIKLMGFGGSEVSNEVKQKNNIVIKRIKQFPHWRPYILYAIFRLICDIAQLFCSLMFTKRLDLIVIQVFT